MSRRLAALAALLALPALAGCLGPAQQPLDPSALPIPALPAVFREGRVELGVPVDVVLVGFEPGTADALQARLEPELVEHGYITLNRSMPPEPGNLHWALSPETAIPMPIAPTARYAVRDPGEAFAAEFRATLAAAAMPEGEGVHDANAVEAWLAGALPRAGIPLRADAPALVLLHAGSQGHGYRTTMHEGWLEPVRAFGERHPFLALDVSAREDPWVTGGGLLGSPATAPYNRPIAAGGDAVVEALEQAARDAVHARLLKGSIYPIATEPCHAVTLILAVSGAALTETLPGYARAADILDAPRLLAAFENLTGEGTVRVDTKVLRLPVDDPALDAMSRGNVVALDGIRWWIDTNWERYWVAHEGCEGYVSLLFYQDPAEVTTGIFGIGTYDPARSHRISVSWVHEWVRLLYETERPALPLVPQRDPSVSPTAMMAYLFGHETGHIMGQTHTFNVIGQDEFRNVGAFESVWSLMAYQPSGRVVDFGTVERANWMRNRAAFALLAAEEAGLQDQPEFRAALEHMGALRWQAAGEGLAALLARAS